MIWRFHDFQVDERRFELRRNGERVAIAPKPLALLLHLARHHPAAVSRSELLRVLWPGVRVTDASLSRAVRAARIALGQAADDDDGIIRTVRGRGYALEGVIAAAPAKQPRANDLPADVPFIDRIRELLQLESVLDLLQSGRGSVVRIAGEPGIGKSRLLEQLAARALSRGSIAVTGNCREEEGAPPFWPWPELVDRLVDEQDDVGLRTAFETMLHDLAPTGASPGRGVQEGRSAAPDAEGRFLLFQGLATLLRRAAAKRSLVILIEDLHWAGAGALDLLRFVARSVAGVPILIGLTYRTAGAPRSRALETALGELASLSNAVPELRLSPFSPQETEIYVETATGAPANAVLLQRLVDATGGNPLFLRELVPLLVSGDGHGSPSAPHVPASVSAALRDQASRLSAPARDLLDVASVIGRSGAIKLLARASGHATETVLDLVEEAHAESLLDVSERDAFRFRHDIVRAAIYERLGNARRIDLHRRVAEAWESIAGADVESCVSYLAYHYVEALPRTSVDKAVQYSVRAAQQAHDALDLAASAQHYRRALRAADHRDESDPAERCDLLLASAEAQGLAGDPAGAHKAIFAAAALARALGSPERLVRAALTICAWPQMVFLDEEAMRLVEEALHKVDRRRGQVRARLLAGLGILRAVGGDPRGGEELLEEALQDAQRIGDLALRSHVALQRLVMLQVGIHRDQESRLALTEEIVDLAARAGLAETVLQCRRHRITLLLELGRAKELDDEIELFTRDSASAHSKLHLVAAFRAMRALVAGRWADARQAIDEAERLADPLSTEDRRFTPAAQRLKLPPERREWEVLARTIRAFHDEFPAVTPWRMAYGEMVVELGRMDEARAVLEQFCANDLALVPRNLSFLLALSSLTEIAWRLREPRWAPALYEALLPYAGRHLSVGLGVSYHGPVSRQLALLACLQGRRQKAAEHFAASLEEAEALGAEPYWARTAVDFASMLATGQPAERRRARELAASAARSALKLGMTNVARAAQEVLEASGQNPARSRGER